jgi:ketosteroid isomerase-like protein
MKTILEKCSTVLLAGAYLFISTGNTFGEPAVPDTTAINSTAEGFHQALAAGKAEEVMALLQPDALIVESGTVQTRDEYQREHLAEDIAYARAVPSTQRDVIVRQEGDAAWVTSTFNVTGKFHDKPVHNLAAETMVLTKTSTGWRIRTIHWSSHKAPSK